VTSTTILVFLAITLLLLFGTVWIGLFLSRRFTEPLLAVAAATQRVAEGDQLEEVASPATDEVAVLVDSFNAMVRRVRSTQQEIRASNQELATLLATIPTGVLSLSSSGESFRPNPAAARLIGEPSWAGSWRQIADLDRSGLESLLEHIRTDRSIGSVQLELEVGGSHRMVDVTIKDLPNGGEVVAMDDLTQLVRAQRQAAWAEVARRIAHEIKNPLTPIRLAAERIQRRAGQLDGDLQRVIVSGTDAIIAHVAGLKELVDSFHQYARMPVVSPRPVPIGRLLGEVVALYENLRDDVAVSLDVATGEVEAMVDAALLRQALVNLLDNAVEAMSGSGGQIDVRGRASGADLILEVADSGPGLPTEDAGRLLQPFFSTKGRGSGMGLALVHRIITDHGGLLELANRETGGAVARITLAGAVTRKEAG
jgi:two-component system nitrogen regulation sensor histidine kinase NtrY